jgi:hypothetical protein
MAQNEKPTNEDLENKILLLKLENNQSRLLDHYNMLL